MPIAGPLTDSDELARHLGQTGVVVLDVRRGERFATAHLPGARHFSVYGINTYDTDEAPWRSFVRMWAFQLSLAGISRDDTVVVYGDSSDEPAARAYWFLRYLGHPRCALLDGGLAAWARSGHETEQTASAPRSASYQYTVVDTLVANWRQAAAAGRDAIPVLLDTRSDEEWYGNDARGADRAGAIPGAVHLEWTHHLTEDGRFKSPRALSTLFEGIGAGASVPVVAYCNTGYRSAHACLALEVAGHVPARNYVGSWQEWGNRSGCLVARPSLGSGCAPLA